MKNEEEIPLQKRKILIIDDETVIGLGCKRVLEKEDFEVNYQSDPRKGLADALAGEYDLILLDLVMPDIDGMKILREINSAGIHTNVIIITGHGSIQTAVEAMKLGASDYLNKPFMPDELKLVIKKVFDRSELVRENISLKKELNIHEGIKGVICESPKMKDIISVVKRIAPTDGTVYITGESGTGKEIIARTIHRLSQRKDKAMIACDCSSLAPTLLESELFGHVKGSFSGAISTKQGLFELAHKGTLFLDEISNLSMEIQSKLLRVLESRMIRKVGDTQEKKIDIRLITASNKDLFAMVKEGDFREDLYYRLQVIPIFLPPLRERREDIVKLAVHFLQAVKKDNDIKARAFSVDAIKLLELYHWPGNIRELKNLIERVAILGDTEIIEQEHLPVDIKVLSSPHEGYTVPDTWEEFKKLKNFIQNKAVADIEKRFLMEALKKANGNVSQAARNVGLLRPNFHAMLNKYELDSREFSKV